MVITILVLAFLIILAVVLLTISIHCPCRNCSPVSIEDEESYVFINPTLEPSSPDFVPAVLPERGV